MEASNDKDLIPFLFKTEYSKIVAVLCRTFGFSQIDIAEDIVSDTFHKAAETWGLKGVPTHPKAWLYKVAENRAKDLLRRQDVFNKKILPELESGRTYEEEFSIDFSEGSLNDGLLEMMFVSCDPILSNEVQITFALRVLCGFSIDEISNALLCQKATINKRLFRAKSKLRESKVELKFAEGMKLSARLDNVILVLYLLFNEGYFSTNTSEKIRKDLCFEAMRLLNMLIQNDKTNTPQANALMALFCFHSSRFEARSNVNGEQVLYENQERSKWDEPLIEKGEYFLSLSTLDGSMTKYHIEAMIAFWHTRKEADEKEKWSNILALYNQLLRRSYSPVAALNRTYALSKVEGNKVALVEALKINLSELPIYHSLLAELYPKTNTDKKLEHWKIALSLTKNESDKQTLSKKINQVEKGL